MRVVADTNTIVSGLLWHGPPRRVLDAARSGALHLYTSATLLAEEGASEGRSVTERIGESDPPRKRADCPLVSRQERV